MPFDGTRYTTISTPVYQQSERLAHLGDFARGVGLVMAVYLIMSGILFPETGTTARLIHGNTIVNENIIASNIMYDKSDWYKLKDMMDHEYEIVVPRYELSAVEAQAWWDRAARHKWTPAGDFGPNAIDP